METMSVYFAHPMVTYGTEEAVRVGQWLQVFHGPHSVRNPEALNWKNLVTELGSHQAVYEAVIEACSEVDVLEWNGYIGRGVFCEVSLALEQGKPVWVVRSYAFHRVIGVQIVDSRDWSYRFGRLLVKEGQ